MFEDESLANKATVAVEKTIHYGEDEGGRVGEPGIESMQVEDVNAKHG